MIDIEYIRKLCETFDNHNHNVYEIETSLAIYEFMDKNIKDISDEKIQCVFDIIHSQDDVFNEYIKEEIMKLEKSDKNELDRLYEVIDSYCENCSDAEWEKMLDDYCVANDENYMGETRKNFENSVREVYEESSVERRKEIIDGFSKYSEKEKEEEEIER